MLHAVCEKVLDHLLYPIPVEHEVPAGFADIDGEIYSLRFHRVNEQSGDFVEEFPHVVRLDPERPLVDARGRRFDKPVDEPAEPVDRLGGARKKVRPGPAAPGASVPGTDCAPYDGERRFESRQRRAQLVRDDRDLLFLRFRLLSLRRDFPDKSERADLGGNGIEAHPRYKQISLGNA